MPVDMIRTLIEDTGDGETKQSQILLQTWDFGGQKEYYVMHHLFLTNRGIYLVVVDLELSAGLRRRWDLLGGRAL